MPYIKRLYQAVTGEAWDMRVYTKDRIDASVFQGMSDTFNYGSLYYDQFKRAETSDSAALKDAFVYFNKNVNREALQASFEQSAAAISDGRHPVSHTPFIKVGSYIAMMLSEKRGAKQTERYSALGAIPFFADYIDMYKANPNYPQDLRFNQSFEAMVAKWNADWTRTWTHYSQHLASVSGPLDLDIVESRLAKLFAGAQVYPNLIAKFLEIRQSYEAQKDWANAAKAAKIAAELYPQSDATNVYYAISLVMLRDEAKARASLQRAVDINRNGIASAGAFSQIGRAIAAIDNGSAIQWLKLAIEIYPREVMLFLALGDIYSRQGRRVEAIETYRKALEIQPNSEAAKEALKKLSDQ